MHTTVRVERGRLLHPTFSFPPTAVSSIIDRTSYRSDRLHRNMPSSKSDRTLSYTAREGGLMYYDIVADSEHLPPRRSPLQFVAKDRRPAVIERMLIIDDLVEGETAYSRGSNIFEQQVSDAVESSRTLSRLSSHLKEVRMPSVYSSGLLKLYLGYYRRGHVARGRVRRGGHARASPPHSQEPPHLALRDDCSDQS